MKLTTSLLLSLALLVPSFSWAQTFNIEADNVTGLNRLLGQPLFVFELPNGTIVAPGFDSLGVHDPGAAEAIPLTPDTPESSILATFLDPNAPFGGQPIDPALLNVKIRDVQTWANFAPDFTLNTRVSPPPHLAAPVFPGVSQAEPNPSADVTLGEWFEARGKMKIKCKNGANSVKIKVEGLLPRRLYTVWALWFTPGPNPLIFPQPLGGVPNAYVTDEKGKATFERDVNFCPPEVAQTGINGSILVELATHLHSDHIAYGGIPSPILGGPNAMPPGTVLHGTLAWNMGNGMRFGANE